MNVIIASPSARALFVIAITLASTSAHAYVGPGLGLGLIGVIIGGIAAFLLAVGGVIWYPVKRLLKNSRAARKNADEDNGQAHDKNDQNEGEKSRQA